MLLAVGIFLIYLALASVVVFIFFGLSIRYGELGRHVRESWFTVLWRK